MTTLRAQFEQTRQNNNISVSTALVVLRSELASLENMINDPKNAKIKGALIARKAKLEKMMKALEVKAQNGMNTIKRNKKDKGFAILAALIYVFRARQAAARAQQVRLQQQRRAAPALKLAA